MPRLDRLTRDGILREIMQRNHVTLAAGSWHDRNEWAHALHTARVLTTLFAGDDARMHVPQAH